MTSRQSPGRSNDGPDFRGQDLSGVNLGGRDLTNAQMQGAILRGTIFNGVTSLDCADLTGAEIGFGTDFTGCDLSTVKYGSKFTMVDDPYRLTKFVKAKLPFQALGLNWRYLDLTGAFISGIPADLSGLVVRRSILVAFDFGNRKLTNARFWGVDLKNANFSQADLSGASFHPLDVKCDLTGANFTKANLSGAAIGANYATYPNGSVRVDDGNILTDADFTGANLTRTSITGNAMMNGCRFDEVDLRTAKVTRPKEGRDRNKLISLRGSTIEMRSFCNSTAMYGPPWDFSFMDLTGAKIVDLDKWRGKDGTGWLAGFKAQYAVLAGVDFTNYDFNRMLQSTDYGPADFTGATLTGVKFSKANLTDAVMRGVRSRREVFSVDANSDEGKTLGLALRNSQAAKVSEIFARRGITMSAPAVSRTPRGQWIVADKPAQGGGPATAVYEVSEQDSGKVTAVLIVAEITPPVFDDANLTKTDFGSVGQDGIDRTVLRGARFNGATMNRADLRYADLSGIDKSTSAEFESTSMVSANLGRAVLSGATLKHTILNDANLIGASLDGADLTGAQLGDGTEKFRIPKSLSDGPAPDEYQKFLAALRARDAGAVAKILIDHGVTLTTGEATVVEVVPDRSWTVKDNSGHPYTVLDWTSTDNSTFLIVYAPAAGASLTGAYMANAVLENANLSGVSATHVQLFGAKAKLDGAILDGCKLSEANLSGASLASVSLYGLDLSGANLIGTRFGNADLRKATLCHANMQGAWLTDAQLAGANLTSAAVAFPLTDGVPSVAGTYLFTLDGKEPATRQVLAELKAAGSSGMPMTLSVDAAAITRTVDGLKKADVAALRQLFEGQGITLPSSAAVSWVGGEDSEAWRVTGGCDYSVWHVLITDSSGRTIDNRLLAGPSMPKLKAAFPPLRWQATVSQTNLPANMWQIFNDNDNPRNFQLGYDALLASLDDGGSVTFYGTSLRVQQLGSIDQTTITPVPLIATQLGDSDARSDGSRSCFRPDTVCPNGFKLEQNRPGTPWEKMLRAKEPPAPPDCVPGPYADCPPVKRAILEAEEARLRGEG